MTHIFVSTTETQGNRDNDFCFVPEGEMVIANTECTRGSVDDECGCRRSLSGAETHKATTTFKVVEVPQTRNEIMADVRAALIVAGWGDPPYTLILEHLEAKTAELLNVAARLPVGTICENRGVIQQRRPRSAPQKNRHTIDADQLQEMWETEFTQRILSWASSKGVRRVDMITCRDKVSYRLCVDGKVSDFSTMAQAVDAYNEAL